MEVKVQLGCDSADYEIRLVIKFLNAKKVSGNEIYNSLCVWWSSHYE